MVGSSPAALTFRSHETGLRAGLLRVRSRGRGLVQHRPVNRGGPQDLGDITRGRGEMSWQNPDGDPPPEPAAQPPDAATPEPMRRPPVSVAETPPSTAVPPPTPEPEPPTQPGAPTRRPTTAAPAGIISAAPVGWTGPAEETRRPTPAMDPSSRGPPRPPPWHPVGRPRGRGHRARLPPRRRLLRRRLSSARSAWSSALSGPTTPIAT